MRHLDDYSFRNATNYHYGQFPPAQLDYARLITPLGKASAALARYDAVMRRLQNNDLLLAPLRRQEAVVSSRIEGTVATLDEVLKFEAERDGEDGQKSRAEVMEVYSYTRALTHAQSLMNNGLPICSRLIKEAHGQLLFYGRSADKQPGQFKSDQNYVVDKTKKQILFVPISAEKLEDGIKAFEDFINEEEREPLIQTALSHVEFESLHPFKDGNGRIGRMLITLSLWARGLIAAPHFYVSNTIEANRDEYIDRLRLVSSEGQWTEWCDFFLRIIEVQAGENLAIAEKIAELYEEMKIRFRQLLASQWSIAALDFIFGTPIFRNNSFTSEAGIPRPTAARFARILSEDGLLTTIIPASGRRPALYAFEPLLRIVRA